MNSLFILPSLDPSIGRNFTHIDLWRRNGGSVIVAAFVRSERVEGGRAVDVVLGNFENAKIFPRLAVYKKALDRLMALLARVEVVFVYTLDNFVFAWMAKIASKRDVKIVFFLMDIREKFIGDKLFNHVARSFLLFAFERSDIVLVTSKHYITDYAKRYLSDTPLRWMEIENKVDAENVERFSKNYQCLDAGNRSEIVIGYFGALRCERSLEILCHVVHSASGNIRVVLYGIFVNISANMISKIDRNKYIEYKGLYSNPDELGIVYSSCSIVWASYPYSENSVGNHLWAKTNRYYEAIYFNKPVIVNESTRDSETVLERNVGLVIDMSDIEKAVAQLLKINESLLDEWSVSLKKIPRHEFIYTDEFSELYKELIRQGGI